MSDTRMIEIEVEVYSSLISEFEKTQNKTKLVKQNQLKFLEKLNQTKNFLSNQETEGNTDKAMKSAMISHLDCVISDVNILINII